MTNPNMSLRDSKGKFLKVRLDEWKPEKWNDGFVDNRGYFHVYYPKHPSATKTGWVRRAHAMWFIFKGQVVVRGWALHHKNKNKLDDRIENLEVMEHGKHSAMHNAKPLIQCKCVVCGIEFGIQQWRINQGKGKYCSETCYHNRSFTNETRLRMSVSQIQRRTRESAK